MVSNKPRWSLPQLIVLARGTPEESVLTHCKRIGEFYTGQVDSAQFGCDGGNNNNCGNCQSRSGS